jgi:hypothetical protein
LGPGGSKWCRLGSLTWFCFMTWGPPSSFKIQKIKGNGLHII